MSLRQQQNPKHNHRINCMQCKHFYITWDPTHPRGCRSFQFKSRVMPSLAVLRSSGMPCMNFEAKQGSNN